MPATGWSGRSDRDKRPELRGQVTSRRPSQGGEQRRGAWVTAETPDLRFPVPTWSSGREWCWAAGAGTPARRSASPPPHPRPRPAPATWRAATGGISGRYRPPAAVASTVRSPDPGEWPTTPRRCGRSAAPRSAPPGRVPQPSRAVPAAGGQHQPPATRPDAPTTPSRFGRAKETRGPAAHGVRLTDGRTNRARDVAV